MICSTNQTQNFYISTLRSSECTSPTPSALCKLNDWPLYNSSLFVCFDKRKYMYIIYDVHDIFATSLSVKLFTITWSIPDKPYLCILTYLLNAQESRNMYFLRNESTFTTKLILVKFFYLLQRYSIPCLQWDKTCNIMAELYFSRNG